MKTILFAVVVFTFWGCLSEDEKHALTVVQNMVQAESITAGTGSSIKAGKGSLSYRSLTLKSGPVLNNPDIPDDMIASLSALSFYQNVSPESLKGKNAIQIELERSFNGSTRNTEINYLIDTLRLVDSVVTYCNQFCKSIAAQAHQEAYDQCAELLKAKVSLDDFKKLFQTGDSLFGPPKTYWINGFEVIHGTLNGEKLNGIQYSVDLRRDSTVTAMDVTYSLRPDIPGIINVQINRR